MTREQAIASIKQSDPSWFLSRDGKGRGNGFICPGCGSGSGIHGTGISRTPDGHYMCWSGLCLGEKGGDIFDLIKLAFHLDSFNECLKKGCEIFGLTIDGLSNDSPAIPSISGKEKESNLDYRDTINAARLGLTEGSEGARYLEDRGIDLELARHYRLGFLFDWRHPSPNVPRTVPTSPRIIIPVGEYGSGYVARDIRPPEAVPEQSRRYTKQHVGSGLFNMKALETSPCFVTEGWADALSIIVTGGNAVALCSTSGRIKLLEALDAMKAQGKILPKLIDALDADSPGRDCADRLAQDLEDRGISFFPAKLLPDGCKDANEALQKDRNAFSAAVMIARQNAEEVEMPLPEIDLEDLAEDQPEEVSLEIPLLSAKTLADTEYAHKCKETMEFSFSHYRQDAAFYPRLSTGFTSLDYILGGGLYPGLFALGAPSGVGKTTLALQITDYLAAHGHHVLYVALEMSAMELIAKSIARITGDLANQTGNPDGGIEYRRILNGEDNPSIQAAQTAYFQTVSPHIAIYEGLGDVGTAEVQRMAEAATRVRGNPPVIMIDYLQILASSNYHLTDKQSIDQNVVALKRLSRDMNTPVVVISSYNRDAYRNRKDDDRPSMADFKESGAIEYTCDVLLALQETSRKNQAVMDIDLYVLKNRRGPKPEKPLKFGFHGKVGAFVEEMEFLSIPPEDPDSWTPGEMGDRLDEEFGTWEDMDGQF